MSKGTCPELGLCHGHAALTRLPPHAKQLRLSKSVQKRQKNLSQLVKPPVLPTIPEECAQQHRSTVHDAVEADLPHLSTINWSKADLAAVQAC